jgi:hypothetical protein
MDCVGRSIDDQRHNNIKNKILFTSITRCSTFHRRSDERPRSASVPSRILNMRYDPHRASLAHQLIDGRVHSHPFDRGRTTGAHRATTTYDGRTSDFARMAQFLVTVKLGGSSSLLHAPRESKAPTPSEHSIWERMGMECGDGVTALGPVERAGADNAM